MTDAERTTPAPEGATPTANLLPGNVCPAWCGEHYDWRTDIDGRPAHPEDAGVMHYSPVVDEWAPESAPGARLVVQVFAFRHDVGEHGPVTVTASCTSPSVLSGMELPPGDARRLGESLMLAADLAEGRA